MSEIIERNHISSLDDIPLDDSLDDNEMLSDENIPMLYDNEYHEVPLRIRILQCLLCIKL